MVRVGVVGAGDAYAVTGDEDGHGCAGVSVGVVDELMDDGGEVGGLLGRPGIAGRFQRGGCRVKVVVWGWAPQVAGSCEGWGVWGVVGGDRQVGGLSGGCVDGEADPRCGDAGAAEDHGVSGP